MSTTGAIADERRASRLAVLILALLPLAVLWPCVFGGRTFLPFDLAAAPPSRCLLTDEQLAAAGDGANYDATEPPIWFEPELRLARRQLLEDGNWPTWNPWARGGAPMHAHSLLGLAYPPHWLALFAAEPRQRLALLAWISFALAGTLMFGLLRHTGLRVLPALFGGALFELSAPMTAGAHYWNRVSSLAWLPGVLWAMLAIHRATGRARWRPTAALAVAIAMAWLAGFVPFAAATTAIGGGVAVLLVARRGWTAGRRDALELALRLLSGFGLGLLLAMPQLLPSLCFFPLSARPAPTPQMLAENRFDWCGLLGYLVPGLFGDPSFSALVPYDKSPLLLWLTTLTTADGGPRVPNFNYTEYSVFASGLGLLLAAFGALCGRGGRRGLALGAFAVLLGLATFAPGFRLLDLLPGCNRVWPFRWMAHASVFVAWLAAIGCERMLGSSRRPAFALAAVALLLAALVPWLGSRPAAELRTAPVAMAERIAAHYRVPVQQVLDHVNGVPVEADRFALAFAHAASASGERGLWLAGTGALLLLFAFARHRPRLARALPLLLLAVPLAELASLGRTLDGGVALAVSDWTPVHEFLAQQRAAAADVGGFTIARASRTGEGIPDQLPPGPLLRSDVRDLHFDTHYDGHSHQPLQMVFGQAAERGNLTKPLAAVLPGKDGAPDRFPLELPLLDLYGVRYLLATEELQHAGTRVGPPLRGPHGEFFVYERPHPLPRAFVVHALNVLADDAAVLRAMVDPAFRPADTALLTAADAEGLAPAAPPIGPPTGPPPPRRVTFVTDRPAEVLLDVGAGAPGWLVLADTMLPGWTATADGTEVAIHRADHWLRLLPVPAAACTVRFLYRAPGLAAGTWLMLLAAAVTALLAWRRRPSSPPPPAAETPV